MRKARDKAPLRRRSIGRAWRGETAIQGKYEVTVAENQVHIKKEKEIFLKNIATR